MRRSPPDRHGYHPRTLRSPCVDHAVETPTTLPEGLVQSRPGRTETTGPGWPRGVSLQRPASQFPGNCRSDCARWSVSFYCTQWFNWLLIYSRRDRSIPQMDRIMATDASELSKLQGFIGEQIEFENKVKEKSELLKENTPYPDPETDCKPPRFRRQVHRLNRFQFFLSLVYLTSSKQLASFSLITVFFPWKHSRYFISNSISMFDTPSSSTSGESKLECSSCIGQIGHSRERFPSQSRTPRCYTPEDVRHNPHILREIRKAFAVWDPAQRREYIPIITSASISVSTRRHTLTTSTLCTWNSSALSAGPWMSENMSGGPDTPARQGRFKTLAAKVFYLLLFFDITTLGSDEVYPGNTGGSLYDGRKQVLYWADVSSEVAFVVPSPDFPLAISRRSSVGATSGEFLWASNGDWLIFLSLAVSQCRVPFTLIFIIIFLSILSIFMENTGWWFELFLFCKIWFWFKIKLNLI